ncbi:MAG: lipoprotein-releasing ABC transporter permease subunit [Pelagibacterales bacterium]|nr:lipoprotein-releasing ABC transporter permease subunit [Pelagibacterales bacterium]
MPFNSFERFIAFRYIKPLRSEGLLSIISWFSFFGICIGVATLIITMSVMNGFRYELENRIIGFNGHIYINNYEKYFEDISQIFSSIDEIEFIDANISDQVLISANSQTRGIILKSFNSENMDYYNFKNKKDDSNKFMLNEIYLGSKLAERLNVEIGSQIKLYTSSSVNSPFGQLPKSRLINVGGYFDTGMSEYDSNYAFLNLKEMQKIYGVNNRISAIEIHLKSSSYTDKISNQVNEIIKEKELFYSRDWKQVNAFFFETLSIERNVMFIILSLIIIVAAFNVITCLFILVKNKANEIAILKTIGTSNISILRIFIIIGSLIGVAGSLIGSLLGIIVTLNLENIRQILNNLFNLNLFPSQFYFIDKIPTIIDYNQIFFIFVFSIIISLLATIYPSRVASKMKIKDIFSNA